MSSLTLAPREVAELLGVSYRQALRLFNKETGPLFPLEYLGPQTVRCSRNNFYETFPLLAPEGIDQ